MKQVFEEDRLIVIGRELTKTFETIKLDTIANMIEFIESDSNQLKGEFVVAIQGTILIQSDSITEPQKHLSELLSKELPPKKAAKITAEFLNGKSKEIYNYLIKK